MWVFTTSGFVSAVRSPNDRTIIVRSRDKDSLVPISKQAKIDIRKTPLADYPYRLEIGHDQFAEWVASQARQIDYNNFKSEVAHHQGIDGKKYERSLHDVWHVMHQLQSH